MELQLKAWITTDGNEDLKHHLEADSSKIYTYDCEHPSIRFPKSVSYFDIKENEHLWFHIQICPASEMARTCDLEWNLMPAIVSAFNDEETADAKVKVGNSTFHVHKLVICTQSDVFRSMFKHEFSEKKSNCVHIQKADKKVVEAMLRYLYSGKVENINQVASRLLSLSDQYQLKGLTELCMDALKMNLTLENIIERLQLLAYPDHLTNFKIPVFEFVKKNFVAIRALSEWQTFICEHVNILDELLVFAFESK
ncbi:Speckle-type POZ protein-like isoform X1 [Aphelenchoides besseyi]|nr:Speckle-type POZ protein-like isoform X1 [Aphelenchoides besseyi]